MIDAVGTGWRFHAFFGVDAGSSQHEPDVVPRHNIVGGRIEPIPDEEVTRTVELVIPVIWE